MDKQQRREPRQQQKNGCEQGRKIKDDNEQENFAMAMALPAKKAKTTCRIIPQKPREVVESDDNFDAFLAKRASLLGNRATLWPSDGPH